MGTLNVPGSHEFWCSKLCPIALVAILCRFITPTHFNSHSSQPLTTSADQEKASLSDMEAPQGQKTVSKPVMQRKREMAHSGYLRVRKSQETRHQKNLITRVRVYSWTTYPIRHFVCCQIDSACIFTYGSASCIADCNYHVQFRKGWSHETDNRIIEPPGLVLGTETS